MKAIDKLIPVLYDEVAIGDYLNVNTGYRPFDDENCLVLDIKEETGLFGDVQTAFKLKTPNGEKFHYSIPHKINGFKTKLTKVIFI